MSGDEENAMRLQRFLARAGVASRRESEKLIAEGLIEVNGKTVEEMGVKVIPGCDKVTYRGEEITLPHSHLSIMLNKPRGYVTTMSDPQNRKTVADLVPVDKYPSLYPIGRLDFDTSGLLLFSTDGDLGNSLIHPRHHIPKTYLAKVEGSLSKHDIQTLEEGVQLDDGITLPAKCEVVGECDGESEVVLTIYEGRNRQVRRMFDRVGHPVIDLKRLSVGSLEMGDLEEGSWRELDAEEIKALKSSSF